MSQAWFRPKTHGYGAYPANWKGWGIIAVYILVEFSVIWGLVLRPAWSGAEPSSKAIYATVALCTLLTLGFVWLTKVKTDGAWRWRWGNRT